MFDKSTIVPWRPNISSSKAVGPTHQTLSKQNNNHGYKHLKIHRVCVKRAIVLTCLSPPFLFATCGHSAACLVPPFLPEEQRREAIEISLIGPALKEPASVWSRALCMCRCDVNKTRRVAKNSLKNG
jgi:hypothetical protein